LGDAAESTTSTACSVGAVVVCECAATEVSAKVASTPTHRGERGERGKLAARREAGEVKRDIKTLLS